MPEPEITSTKNESEKSIALEPERKRTRKNYYLHILINVLQPDEGKIHSPESPGQNEPLKIGKDEGKFIF